MASRRAMRYLLRSARSAVGLPVKPLTSLPAREYSIIGSPIIASRKPISAFEANKAIGDLLGSEKPFMVARFGQVEIASLVHIFRDSTLGLLDKFYVWSQSGLISFSPLKYAVLMKNAGFFPLEEHSLRRFYETMLRACMQVDILGSWADGESHFAAQLHSAQICSLKDLEPYYHQAPWSQYLKGKTVLVIHPFSETIQAQYSKRNLLFSDPCILPEFTLKTMPSVQSIACNKVPYDSWFDALDCMIGKALDIEFDVAIVGCGAYGFPLAARLKAAGRQAIHLGGATQILFGVKGRRWDHHPVISSLYNSHWVRPSREETPLNAESIESGCYW